MGMIHAFLVPIEEFLGGARLHAVKVCRYKAQQASRLSEKHDFSLFIYTV